MKELIEKFQGTYGKTDIRAVRSSLRICPIEAHSDHKIGRVIGMTLDASLDMQYSPTEY